MTETPKFQYFHDLIEYQGKTIGEKPYLLYENDTMTFADFDKATCRAANGLTMEGVKPGDGVAILMGNCPEYLYLFYGLHRTGIYNVPVNVSLKGEGLKFILSHSDAKILVIDDTLYPNYAKLESPVGAIKKIFVRRTTDLPVPDGTQNLDTIFDASPQKPDHTIVPQAISCLMYTSGTTGFPKGVVFRMGVGGIDERVMIASMILLKEDILYTALPLFHANALTITAGFAMAAGVPFGLDQKFSASRFWDRVRHFNATQFNAIGAMIPILMKQPKRPNDGDNPVRFVISAACPANLWEAFENRFNVKIWESYGAVDGGGVSITNIGNAPVGSVGKPEPHIVWKLVDNDGKEVPQGEPGELISKAQDKKAGGVEYYKNPEATSDKVKGGWLYSGDMFYADQDSNLYFVDRKSDCMRRRGENISSWDVENVVEKHPSVAICAAFGVPSELGEDEVMVWIKPKAGVELDLKELMLFCGHNMAHFMVPRYVDVVDEIPRTGTLRNQKAGMKKQGVTERSWDREREMPDLKLK